MNFKRKELAKNAKKNLKKHYWLLVAVCLFAAFIGSEFTETMEAFKSLGTMKFKVQHRLKQMLILSPTVRL